MSDNHNQYDGHVFGRHESGRLRSLSRRSFTTFYIASPFDNRDQVIQLADYLKVKNCRWANNHDWTKHALNESSSEEQRELWAARDVRAAIVADLFILLLKDQPSAGAHGELCARWTAGKEIHLIQEKGKWHLFHDLPGIIRYATINEFLKRNF